MFSLVSFYYYEDEENGSESIRVRNGQLRDGSNIFDLPEYEFKANFRMSKECFQQIFSEIAPKMKTTSTSAAIRPELKFATFLRFLVSDHFCAKWISMATTPEAENDAKTYFYANSGLPGVIGCVDGTHVRIASPRHELKHLYYNRKGYYSINVMIICDQNMTIRTRHRIHFAVVNELVLLTNTLSKFSRKQRIIIDTLLPQLQH